VPYGSGAPAATCSATGRAGSNAASASVARHTVTSAPSASVTSATTAPGSACSSAVHSRSPGWAAPVVPTVAAWSGTRPVADAQALGQRRARPLVQAGDGDVVDLLGGDAGALQGRGPRLQAQRHVAGLAEALLPDLAVGLLRGPPAVEELLGGARRRQVLGQQRAARAVADHQRHGAVAAGGLVGTAGEAATEVGGHHQRVPVPSSAARSAPLAERTDPTAS
jgi:hypothetical protein